MVALIFEKSINPLYLYEAVQDQIKSSFIGSKPQLMLLADFLTKEGLAHLQKEIDSANSKKIFVPHKFSFEEINLKLGLFSCNEFFNFIRLISGIKVSKSSISISKFRHRDFTLLHDDVAFGERFIFFYILGNKEWKAEWGGQTIFTFGDARDPIVFESKANSLAIVKVPKGMRGFVKYIKHFSGKNEFVKIEGVLS